MAEQSPTSSQPVPSAAGQRGRLAVAPDTQRCRAWRERYEATGQPGDGHPERARLARAYRGH
jgi:hypothetical protein